MGKRENKRLIAWFKAVMRRRAVATRTTVRWVLQTDLRKKRKPSHYDWGTGSEKKQPQEAVAEPLRCFRATWVLYALTRLKARSRG